MSDRRPDELAESARNRGLKLVRSRVRTPGKPRFGKVGLTDPSGKPVFGMDTKGPAAKPEDVEDYVRNVGARDWGASLEVAVLPRKAKATKPPAREAANDRVPESKPKPKRAPAPPKPAPKPKIRDAKPSDAKQLTHLIHELGHEMTEKQVRKNLSALKKLGETPLVATLDKKVVGLCGISKRVMIHRPEPLGRITALALSKDSRGKGIGRMLVETAEQWMRTQGCRMAEVTSNDRRAEAHAFYRHLGYERASIRFFKKL